MAAPDRKGKKERQTKREEIVLIDIRSEEGHQPPKEMPQARVVNRGHKEPTPGQK